MGLATSHDQVSAFCRAVVTCILPRDLFGQGVTQESNLRILMQNIDTFIRARRFESFSLEKVMQGMKVSLEMSGAMKLLIFLGP